MKGFVRLGYNYQERFGGFQDQQADSAIADVATGLDINVGSPGLVNLRAFYVNEDFDVDNVNVPDPFTSFVSNRHHTTSDDYGLSAQWSRGFGTIRLARDRRRGLPPHRRQGRPGHLQRSRHSPAPPTSLGEGTQTSVGVFG